MIEIFKTFPADYVFDNFFKGDLLEGVFVLKLESFCDGLVSSLSIGGVTSAGTNLFIEVWKSDKARNYLKKSILDIFRTESINVIQNLYNYWLPHIVKNTPEIILEFFDDIKQSTDPKHWYPSCCLLVLCRKNGLINEFQEDERILQLLHNCSVNSNESLRSLYFQFVCISPKTFISPLDEEYDMLKRFLFCNINSDCTYLRQSIVNSFTLFIIRIRDSTLNNFKLLKKNSSDSIVLENLSNMVKFMTWIHEFLKMNLNDEANYQRKYLSLMLYDVILRYLNGGTDSLENKRKGLCRKGNMKNQGVKICEYLSKENKWQFTDENSLDLLLHCVLDPTNDVRELAVKIMMEYFLYSDFVHAKDTIVKAFGLCNSTTCHETECGALYLVLLLNLQKQDVVLTWINDITGFQTNTIIECLTKVLQLQYIEFEKDCVKAVLSHKPIYGLLTAIKFILNRCTLNEYILNVHALNYILETTEKITMYCLESFAVTAPKSEYMVAPSFSEMDDAITHLLSNSQADNENKSPNMYQDVFNCLWMSLKLCTDICSTLATATLSQSECISNSAIKSYEVITRCSYVIVSALTRCRHKGVIEGAGASLANFIRHLTKTDPSSKLPEEILEKHILSTLTANYKGPSMTRRGAGMGILFHKLVSSDSRDNKPLLKHAMDSLLRILKAVDKIQTLHVEENDENDLRKKQGEINDIIEASVLHYIKGLVQDSSLKSDLAPYMSELTALAFKYFFDPSWPIRNAALQLFGAIVPKFIGQKKGLIGTIDNNSSETKSSEGILYLKMDYLFVDAGELLLHYPQLLTTIQNTLMTIINNENNFNRMSDHGSLVPILSLLSGVIIGLSILYEEDLKNTLLNFQACFIKLFSSPIQVVRNLSAKCFACLTPLSELKNKIFDLCDEINLMKNENFKHGSLLALSYLVDKFLTQGKFMFDDGVGKDISDKILELYSVYNNSTFYTRTLILDIVSYISNYQVDLLWINAYEELLECLNSGTRFDFGMPIYVQTLTKILINHCDLKLIPNVLEIILKNNISDVSKTFLIYFLQRMDVINTHESYDSQSVFNILLNYLLHEKSIDVDIICLIMQAMYKNINPQISCSIESIQKLYKIYVESKLFSVNISTLAICVISSMLKIDKNTVCDLLFIKHLINTICNYAEYCTEDVRMNVAKSLVNIIFILHKQNKIYPEFFEDKIKCVSTIINLMQDENVEIRNEVTKFYSLYAKYEGKSINPTVCLLLFLNSDFLKDLFGRRDVYLNKKLQDLEERNGIDSQNAETLQYLTNVFYESFFLKMVIQKSITLPDSHNDLKVNDEYFRIA